MTTSLNDTSLPPLRLAEEAWDRVATGYQAYWSPRFSPYWRAGLESFQPPAEGAIVVPGCGPGDELLLLAGKFPGRAILATDLSPRMAELARRRVREAGLFRILIACDEAAQTSARIRSAGGIFSSFLLQLLPDPLAAVADWAAALRSGGQMALLFWPRQPESGAFASLSRILKRITGEERPDWEAAILDALPGLGLHRRSEQTPAFEMQHDGPEAFWNALIESGPFQALLRRLGQAAMDEARAAWLQDHGLERRGSGWVDRPAARLWILDRTDSPSGHH